ncbi:hypothetical protein KVR01_003343 [Diaporthe batatas]|uniref:uncharacterized protein n=1 Tax=Diaporthe batatas TaxID=748121 RepID=UPI001D047D29|nr:uncharacterized protein KVR01_003343 [Diaporthe batatas]KAG8167654.1 hypothetical protein KVR01_003343 [Diaporthe batatas]
MDLNKTRGRPTSGSEANSSSTNMGRPSTNASSTSRNSTSLKSPLTATSSSNRTYPHSGTVDDGEPALSNDNDIWSRSDSDDSNDDAESAPAASERSSAKGSGSRATGFFRSLVHRISKSVYKRYGFIPNNQQEQDRNAQQNPRSSVLGIDLEPVKPPYLVSNCHFQIRDATEDWDLNTTFDFVHARLKDLGSSLYYPTQYKPLLEKHGFENITVTKYGAPTNACYPGKKLQKIGTMMTKNWTSIIEPLTLSVFIDGLGWSAEDVKKFLMNVKREIPDTRYHSFMTLMTVYCRKPRIGSASTSVSSFQSTPVPEHATRRSNDQLTHIAEGSEPSSA